MPQLEYGDYYKFRVSVGIALIIVSFVVPWLFLREPFDLLLENTQLLHLTPTAQALVSERQHLLEEIFLAVPWFSLASFVSGLMLASIGLVQWRRRQSLRDKSEELSLQKLELELTAMTPQQVEEKLEANVEQQLRTAAPAEVASAASEFRRVEQAVRDRLSACLGDFYTVRANQRLGNAEYDAILEPKIKSTPDVIVDIKYIRKGFHSRWLRESVGRLVLANDYYVERLKRPAVSLLLIVTAEPAQLSDHDFERLKVAATEQLVNSRTTWRVERLSEAQIESLSCAAFGKLILG